MSDEPLTKARFDHVDRQGELVFEADGVRFAVSVDETLERAVLEAKQIAGERNDEVRPTPTLPISQIQALIRAGADPARVAERYGLKEALVRRFSASVETEKQYAIEQFLRVPAPKESRVHTVAELIERTLAAARIGMESVSWKATRRGLEPWKIIAQFDSAGRRARAEWTWNMHDNAVVCLNGTARKLIGEMPASGAVDRSGAVGAPDDGIDAAGTIPGDSVRSARIERAVSSWGTPEPSLPPARPATARMVEPVADTPVDTEADAAPGGQTDAKPMPSASTGTSPLSPASAGDDAVRQPDSPVDPLMSAQGAADETPSATRQSTSPVSSDHATEHVEPTADAAPEAKPRKRSKRSAVPSWDEILFGD